MDFLTLKLEAFGLDISDLSLKIVKLKKRGKFLKLASFGEEKIEEGIIKEGEIKNEEKLAEILKNALNKVKGEKLKTKYVIASLPEEKAFFQVIPLPKMPPEHLKSAIVYEAENYIPLPIEKVYLDYQIVSPLKENLDHYDVLIAAMSREIVDSYLSTLKKAGLQPLVFEVESQAIVRALIKNEVSTSPLLLIDLGATRTSLIIFSGKSLRFTTSLPISSRLFTELISKNLGISQDKAEELKIKYGLKYKYKVKIGDEIKKEKGEVFEILLPALVDLTQQIKKYLEYYRSHASHEHLPQDNNTISKALLCGGGANLKGLSDFLSCQLKFPVQLGNPWVNILPEGKKETKLSFEESLKYTTALGLALRAIKENDKSITA
jgi:type IV pilus assembly protein PilM